MPGTFHDAAGISFQWRLALGQQKSQVFFVTESQPKRKRDLEKWGDRW
jgi:hypothetical protein